MPRIRSVKPEFFVEIDEREVGAEAERWQAELAAARDVVEAARRVVNAEHDVDPVDVYELGQAIRRYDERCGGVSQ